VINLCKKELGGFEIPKKVIFVEELPKTTTGKLEKYKIRDQYNTVYSSQ
jgi:long-chain acyl-CoA synthetase